MFSRLKTMWRLNEGAAALQNLLVQHACPGAKDLAYRWVAEVNAQRPDLFSGHFGQRPHRISIAAVALAQGFLPRYEQVEAFAHRAMGTLLTEVAANGRLYPFNGMDHRLLEAADKLYVDRLIELDTAA